MGLGRIAVLVAVAFLQGVGLNLRCGVVWGEGGSGHE